MTSVAPAHPRLERLPDWPARTIAVLSTVDPDPFAIPVSAPRRAGDDRILIALHRDRASLARLRRHPEVAVTILAEGNIALTARGRAHVVEATMASAPDYAAVAIDVEHIDDHRQPAFRVESGPDRRWVDKSEQHALRTRTALLGELGDTA